MDFLLNVDGRYVCWNGLKDAVPEEAKPLLEEAWNNRSTL